jgi:tripeptide aminopeptidase
MNRKRLLDRFVQYVQFHTTANENAPVVPSSPGQIELGKLLVKELKQLGIPDVVQDEHGIVIARLPANVAHNAPTVAFNAHLDTSPDASGEHVQPQIIQNYGGEVIVLPGDPSKVIRASECPELAALAGCTLITTDGKTLLGGDDKAGVAIIMQLLETLIENPSIPHGPVLAMFTCDEEIGRGVKHVDVSRLAATACYTFDGGGADQIDSETFSADLAIVRIQGINIHPSIGKGRMVNALRAASAFIDRLPREWSPEQTHLREPFLHPYSIQGTVGSVELRLILRSFETPQLGEFAQLLREISSQVESAFPGAKIEVEIVKQYRNMADGLAKDRRAVEFAKQAHRNLGRTYQETIVRGGTDGSQLTELGLPTPNLSSGQHNIHSPLEFACLDEMVKAVEVGVEIIKLWGAERA